MTQQHDITVTGIRGHMSLSISPPVSDEIEQAVMDALADRNINWRELPSGTTFASFQIEDDGSVRLNVDAEAFGLTPQRHDPQDTTQHDQRQATRRQPQRDPAQSPLFEERDETPTDQRTDPQQRLGESQPQPDRDQDRQPDTEPRDSGQMSLADAARHKRLDTFEDENESSTDTATDTQQTTTGNDGRTLEDFINEYGHDDVIEAATGAGEHLVQLSEQEISQLRSRIEQGDNMFSVPLVVEDSGFRWTLDLRPEGVAEWVYPHEVQADIKNRYGEFGTWRDRLSLPDRRTADELVIGQLNLRIAPDGDSPVPVESVEVHPDYQQPTQETL